MRTTAATAGDGSTNHFAHGQHADWHVEDEDTAGLLRILGEEPMGIDSIIERSGIAPGRASALLVTLEVGGRIRQLDGKRFVQVRLG